MLTDVSGRMMRTTVAGEIYRTAFASQDQFEQVMEDAARHRKERADELRAVGADDPAGARSEDGSEKGNPSEPSAAAVTTPAPAGNEVRGVRLDISV